MSIDEDEVEGGVERLAATGRPQGGRALPAFAEAALWMLGAMASFMVLAVSGREASHAVGAFEVMLVRAIGTILVITAVAAATGGIARVVRTNRLGLHLARNVIHFVGQYLWLVALGMIPLAHLFAFEFTAPIWVAILAPILLAERMTIARAGAAALGFLGILVVARPFGAAAGAGLDPGLLVALGSAVGFALSTLAVKRLSATDSALTVVMYQGLLQAPISLAFAYSSLTMPDPRIAFHLAMVTLASITAHYSITRAFRLADVLLVIPLDFLRLPLIAIVGWLVYAEPLDPLVFVGGALIIAGNLWSIGSERRRRI
ncbi:MAG: DMT family transporter [Hyphomicrobiaceae bacterium]